MPYIHSSNLEELRDKSYLGEAKEMSGEYHYASEVRWTQ